MASMVPLASLFVARLDSVTGKFEYCSAGHPPALLLRKNGTMERLSEGGLLLGVIPNAPYVRGSVELGQGDILLGYSDGVLESLNSAEEEFGAVRLEKELRRNQSESSRICCLFSTRSSSGFCCDSSCLRRYVVGSGASDAH